MFYLTVNAYKGGGHQVAINSDNPALCAAGSLVFLVPQRGRESLDARIARAKSIVDLLNKGEQCV